MKLYVENKIEQFRSMAENPNLTDAEIVSFLQELVGVGYGDGADANSISDWIVENHGESSEVFNTMVWTAVQLNPRSRCVPTEGHQIFVTRMITHDELVFSKMCVKVPTATNVLDYADMCSAHDRDGHVVDLDFLNVIALFDVDVRVPILERCIKNLGGTF